MLPWPLGSLLLFGELEETLDEIQKHFVPASGRSHRFRIRPRNGSLRSLGSLRRLRILENLLQVLAPSVSGSCLQRDRNNFTGQI